MKNKTNMKPLPDYGDLMEIKEFAACVKAGLFIPYDGNGYYATETEYNPKLSIWDNDIKRPKWATHVIWFNK